MDREQRRRVSNIIVVVDSAIVGWVLGFVAGGFVVIVVRLVVASVVVRVDIDIVAGSGIDSVATQQRLRLRP